ncbi:hypothetical protein [Streptomyces sp. NPDC008141]|uniref:hypothetical protein n=1 Tax=Streptomyces sp. NPDC008141 TaxID=3364815 RepID=UPI0036E8C69C
MTRKGWCLQAAGQAVLAGLLVLAAGFGALLAFSAATPRPTGLPGLFDYVSATWGDGLALPAMTAALSYAIGRLHAVPRERMAAAAAAVLGAALGAATQMQWLRDDTPHLNWTLPRPHHFNTAGVYHAVFLTAMCAITAALWTAALLRIGGASSNSAGRRAALAAIGVALLAAVSFSILLTIDSLPARPTAASTATVVAMGIGAALLLSLLALTALWIRRAHSQN